MSEIDPESLVERVAKALQCGRQEREFTMAMPSWDYETESTKKRYRDSAKKLVGAPLDLLKEIEAFLAGAESEPDVDLSDQVVTRLKEMVAAYDNDMCPHSPSLKNPPRRKMAFVRYALSYKDYDQRFYQTEWMASMADITKKRRFYVTTCPNRTELCDICALFDAETKRPFISWAIDENGDIDAIAAAFGYDVELAP